MASFNKRKKQELGHEIIERIAKNYLLVISLLERNARRRKGENRGEWEKVKEERNKRKM